MRKSKASGFTLIELMIAVVILSILVGIAFPSYQDSVRKTRRAEGQAMLMQAAQAQERHFTENNRYADTISTTVAARNINLDQNSENGAYTLTLGGNANAYTFTVAPTQADPDCGWLAIDETGAKTSQTNNAICW